MRDLEMFSIIEKEENRQKNNVELIASENFVSKEVREAQGSVLTNKYAEGYPGKRYYGGCVNVDLAEELTRKRACELFKAEHVNVQPHSGSQANIATPGCPTVRSRRSGHPPDVPRDRPAVFPACSAHTADAR